MMTHPALYRIEDELSNKIIGAAIEVHRVLGGPELLESVYEAAFCHELQLLGLQVKQQVAVPIIYKGSAVKSPLYLDLLVGNNVIVEVKSLEKIQPIHKTQLLTYLRLTNLKLGLVINFGQETIRHGICRVVNGF